MLSSLQLWACLLNGEKHLLSCLLGPFYNSLKKITLKECKHWASSCDVEKKKRLPKGGYNFTPIRRESALKARKLEAGEPNQLVHKKWNLGKRLELTAN